MKNKTDLLPLIEKYINNTCTARELNMLLEHLSVSEGEKSLAEAMDELWHQQENLAMYNPERKDELFQKLLSQAQPAKKERAMSVPYGLLKFAATLLLLAAVAFLMYEFQWIPGTDSQVVYLEKVNRSGQKSTITLPDGSVIRLNSASKLTYPEKFDGTTRTLTLEGEAFFTVTPDPDKPFMVKTAALTTTVLGTSFNIKAFRDEDIAITVMTGKVRVRNSEKTPPSSPLLRGSRTSDENMGQISPNKGEQGGLILAANQQVTYNPATKAFKKQSAAATNAIAWTDGWLIFDNELLREVAKVLERWYGMPIIIREESLKNKQVTLKQQGESLHTVLRAISYAGGFIYKIENDKVMIELKTKNERRNPMK